MTPSAPATVNTQVALPGIIGGLGPLAHIQFEQILLDRSCRRGAGCDQAHPEWVLMNATQTPDRTQSIKGVVSDCTPYLVKYGQRLHRAGADFLVVTCNTAHAFYPQVQAQLEIPWIPLMHCTTQVIREQFPAGRQVGILATDGTLHTQLYHQSLSQAGLTPICPGLGSPMQKTGDAVDLPPYMGNKNDRRTGLSTGISSTGPCYPLVKRTGSRSRHCRVY